MKKLLWAVISSLMIISAQGKVGIKEAEAIRDYIKTTDPKRFNADSKRNPKYNIIALAANCKQRRYRCECTPDNTSCEDLARFMFEIIDHKPKLNADVYPNIENSMMEIIKFEIIDDKPKLNADVYANIENSMMEIIKAQEKFKNNINQTIISAQGEVGIKEAEAIRNYIEREAVLINIHLKRKSKKREINFSEDLDLLKKYEIIELVAHCKNRNGASKNKHLKINCQHLAEFMFNTINSKPKLDADVYANIENSMIEIIEIEAKLDNLFESIT